MHFFQRDIYLKSFKKKNSEIPQSCIYHIMYFDFLLNVYMTFIFHPPKATTDLKNIEDLLILNQCYRNFIIFENLTQI